MHSWRLKLLLSFLLVALITVGVLGLLLSRVTTAEFGSYLSGRAGDSNQMERMMSEMMGAGASDAMLVQMTGPAERAYLSALTTALWLGGGIALLVAAGAGYALSRQIAAPVHALTLATRRASEGDLTQRVPATS